MKKIHYIIISALVTLFFWSCKKGATGETGPNGATGPQGASAVYTIDSTFILATQWAVGSPPYQFEFDEPYIDNPESSLIEVYYSQTNNVKSFWKQLPFYGAFATGDEIYFSYDAYSIHLWYIPNSSAPPNLYVRVIIIPKPL